LVRSAEKDMTTSTQPLVSEPAQHVLQHSYLFRDLDEAWITALIEASALTAEKLYSNRPVYTAFRPGEFLESLYLVLSGGPIIIRSSPLDRVIAIYYPGSCFGMGDLPLGGGQVSRAFPSLVEAYKTTDVTKLPFEILQHLYQDSDEFRDRYHLLFELQAKFQHHLLNCSTYPPQAVAALLRALVYQERTLGNQPNADGVYEFDLPVDIIARASQLNHRTVEQVLKGLQQIGILETARSSDLSGDMVRVLDPEALKEVYSSTRDKVSWWPLR
jgi:hypothetical protein